jgi:transposase
MLKTRMVHNKEFKEKAVQLVENSSKSVSEVARNLGIHDNTLRKWYNNLHEAGKGNFPGQDHRQQGTDSEEEIRKLKQELLTVTMERDILKKAMVIFSQP